jgi:hypothetical protein
VDVGVTRGDVDVVVAALGLLVRESLEGGAVGLVEGLALAVGDRGVVDLLGRLVDTLLDARTVGLGGGLGVLGSDVEIEDVGPGEPLSRPSS